MRCKFIEADKGDVNLAKKAVAYIGQLYDIERYCRDNKLSHEQRLTERNTHATPIMAAFKQWLDDNAGVSFPKSPIRKAIKYTLSLWPRLSRYLENGEVEIGTTFRRSTIVFCVLHKANCGRSHSSTITVKSVESDI
ncbi:MAG: IS66 family transposase [Schleiferiaceae bacterium]|nr:IS66 family transposase [Schleiferiaceae bacterium]